LTTEGMCGRARKLLQLCSASSLQMRCPNQLKQNVSPQGEARVFEARTAGGLNFRISWRKQLCSPAASSGKFSKGRATGLHGAGALSASLILSNA